MENQKVIQITANQDGVFGLTEAGQLIMYDKNAACFVLRAEASILTMDKATLLKKVSPLQDPKGRHRPFPIPNAPVEVKKEMNWKLIAIIIFAILLLLILRNIFLT